MHTITPLSQASRQTVESLAETAVHNSIPLDEANVFEPGSAVVLVPHRISQVRSSA